MATNTSTFEQYENLPGVKVSYEDGNLNSGTQATESNSQSILIIGTAIDGPVGEPVSVNAIGGPKAAEKMFGGLLERVKVEQNGVVSTVKVPHQGTLIRSMYEAYRSGSEDVRLLRVSGRIAKTELPAKDPNSEVNQILKDVLGDSLIPGNIAFSKALSLASGTRLVNIEKVEEFAGIDVAASPLRTLTGSTGYTNVDTTIGSETVYFAKNLYRPTNTVKISYKAKERSYTDVTHSMDGVALPSTLGLLTQDPTMTNYFASQVGNWSDDPLHTVNIFIKDAAGVVNAIPSTNSSGDFLWRVGKEDPTITNELRDVTTSTEFQQGGIRFTSAYQAEVALGTYPALTASVVVTADYHYYNDVEVVGSVTQLVPGAEKVTSLNFMPVSNSLEVSYVESGVKSVLTETTDYTINFPSDPAGKVEVRIKSGAGPVGAQLFAYYKTNENSTQGAKLIVNAAYPGKIYGGIDDPKDSSTVYGVKVAVEYEVNTNGTLDMTNRVIRFIKPSDKRITSSDTELRFRTKELSGIRTLREFANYVNGLSRNNIIRLDVPVSAGEVPVVGLIVTDYTVSPIDGRYDYRPINLGEVYSESTSSFSLLVDSSKKETEDGYYPWLGSDGFFNAASLLDTKNLYETLGGKYELVAGTLDEFELVEQGIYSKLENYSTDIIWLAEIHSNTAIGSYAEDGSLIAAQDRDFSTQLAQHCAMVTAKSYETISVIGMAPAPLSGLREIQEYVDLATNGLGLDEEKTAFYLSRGINPNYQNRHYMYNLATHEQIFNDEGDPIDIGRYVNVVFGPEVGLAHEKLGSYVANGAGIYAALITNLNAEISTTNQEVSATGLRYNLSESQHNQLAGGRYVTFDSKLQSNGTRKIVVKDGVTAATPNSDYQRLSTVRITHATVQLIRQKADRFIGLPNGIAQRNALATEIQAGLDRLKELGVLINFKFSIFSSAKDRVLGNAFIQLELVPAYETRKIYTSVGLRASL